VLVTGGGAVALRKVKTLLAAGAKIRVVADQPHPGLLTLARQGDIALEVRPFQDQDVEGARLVFATTDSGPLNAQVAAIAREGGVPVNVADAPELCDFFVPSSLVRGPVEVAVSSGGLCPALSVEIRKTLEGVVGPEVAVFARDLARVREEIKARFPTDERRRRDTLLDIVQSDWRKNLTQGDQESYQRILNRWKSQS